MAQGVCVSTPPTLARPLSPTGRLPARLAGSPSINIRTRSGNLVKLEVPTSPDTKRPPIRWSGDEMLATFEGVPTAAPNTAHTLMNPAPSGMRDTFGSTDYSTDFDDRSRTDRTSDFGTNQHDITDAEVEAVDELNGTIRDKDGNPLARTHSSMRLMWPKDHYEPAHVFPDVEPPHEEPWNRRFINGFSSSVREKQPQPLSHWGLANADPKQTTKYGTGGW